MIKKTLNEQQKYLERMRREETKGNLFISGIPNELNLDMSDLPEDGADENKKRKDPVKIIQHVLQFVNPAMTPAKYDILKNFDAKDGYSRHSAKIRVKEIADKIQIFKGCVKFKHLSDENYLRKIFIKNDDPSLTRQENDRLRTKMKGLRELDALSENRYTIKQGKLLKNEEEVVDEFNLSNQLFQ